MDRRKGFALRTRAGDQPPGTRRARRKRLLCSGAAAAAVLGVAVPMSVSAASAAPATHTSGRAPVSVITKLPAPARTALRGRDRAHGRTYFDGLGVKPGKIKHVWLIILENKSYDASFTGLNNNTYLWKTLPSQGNLLKNYYGTGHDSLDNYLSMTSGQAPLTDTQDDCPDYNSITGSVDYSGNLNSNPNYGQLASAAGPNAAPGQNGCVYPASVPTLFNQFDKAGVSWKGYAQDLEQSRRRPAGPFRRDSVLRGALRLAGGDRQHDSAEPGVGQQHRPVCAQALPVPVV